MHCDQVQRLLSFEPKGATAPQNPALRHHLETCAGCRSFWQALQQVDKALTVRPLARLPMDLVPGVMRVVQRTAYCAITPPFSRAFWLFSTMLTLLALVGGASLLHYWSTAVPWNMADFPINLWVNPVWARDASTWLSTQDQEAAEVVLAAMAGLLITAAGAVIGYKVSDHKPDHTARRRTPPR